MIDITGKDRARVLKALYNSAKPQGMGFMSYTPQPMTDSEAAEMLKHQNDFDYLNGRVMKIRIVDNLDTRLYDRDNGEGAAEKAIEQEFAN